ncbi:uncharacterized protein HMPREF1541_00835 [Cyphellophora europaea CBS 101466]|uniref:Kinetochore protein SPC25 n=1 Tax=Cyphellophora europaea (strain CBS 101466) TaxID=1220924 RepID=W2SFG3_CYPE1|nr:uncharacterized protein HMPREF1541_00835 [Cyphellophora europaea CBS 101466]ETN46649.1 hypothetical protein HMPREF1541_00835 [Cyphellophora europaea CBS 101466]
MAAATAFSTSTSFLRASQSQQQPTYSYSGSHLTQLPSVDIPFEDLRKRMNEFTVRFDAFLEKGRRRVLEEHNEFKAKLSELHEDNKSTATSIATLQSTLATQSHVHSRELAEKEEMNAQITKLETRHSSQQQQRDRLRAALAATQRQIDAKLAAQRAYAEKQDGQSALNAPELQFWETYLGMRFEGAGDESRVKVIYSFPAGKGTKGEGEGGEREAVFELKVPETGTAGYEVVYMKPRLEREKVEKVVDKLNETREIGVLLKGMRGLFAEEMK